MPALRVRDQEIAEDLDARDRLQLFRIDEVGIEREGIDVAKQLHETTVLLDEIVRQHRDTKASLARAQPAEHVVDRTRWGTRALAVAADLEQLAAALQVRRHWSAKQDDAVIVQFLVRTRRTAALEIIRRGGGGG